uniref:F-box domain-containing protein n=1 Tax=Panagrellus redivivus TaxID=6233 RepID=A0A7E4W7E0_PANRE
MAPRRKAPAKTDQADTTDADATPSTSQMVLRSRPGEKRKLPAPKVEAKRSRKTTPKCQPEPEKSSPKAGTGHFSQLPIELLANVLEYLNINDLISMEFVNRRCYKVARQYVWPKITALDHETLIKNTRMPELDLVNTRFHMRRWYIYKKKRQPINDKFVKLILSRTNLIKLDLACYPEHLTYNLGSFAYMAPALKHLDLSLIQLTNKSLKTIARYCQQLEVVILEQCFTNNRAENGLSVFFTKLKKLKILNLAENNRFYGDSLKDVTPGLKYLSIANCYNVQSAVLDQLSLRVPNLEALIIDNHDGIRANSVNIWLTRFKKLKLLELSNVCNQAGEHEPLDFRHLKDLEMLTGVYNPQFKESTFVSLRNSPKLRSLDITFSRWMTPIGLEELCKLKQLRCLNLFHSTFYGNDGTVNIKPLFTELQLEYLNLNDCHQFNKYHVASGLYHNKTLKVCELVSPIKMYKEIFHHLYTEHPNKPNGPELTVVVEKMTNLRKIPSWMNAVRYDNPADRAAFTNTRDWRHIYPA